MEILLEIPWNFTLYSDGDHLYLSVICGRASIYTITIQLNEIEGENYSKKGNAYIEKTAQEIRFSPQNYLHRNIKKLS